MPRALSVDQTCKVLDNHLDIGRPPTPYIRNWPLLADPLQPVDALITLRWQAPLLLTARVGLNLA